LRVQLMTQRSRVQAHRSTAGGTLQSSSQSASMGCCGLSRGRLGGGGGITRKWASTTFNSVFCAASPTVMPLSRYVRELHTAAACLSRFGQISAPFCKGANALWMTGTIPWKSGCTTPGASFLLSFMHLKESFGQAKCVSLTKAG